MTTKERIIEEALTLFSINGYKGTSVKQIADAVGIKDSSLYKHYKSKQEILDTIVIMMREHIDNMAEAFGLPSDDDVEQAVLVYSQFDEKMLVEFSKKILIFYLTDSVISRFWRMGNVEQFQTPEVYELYARLFLSDSIIYQTELFNEMKKQKIFINDVDAEVMAMSFYCPIFFLLSKYAGRTDKIDEALNILEKQVKEFYRVYKIK